MTARQRHRIKMLWPVENASAGDVPSWTVGAPCKYRPELFFSDDPANIAEAKNLCTTVCHLDRRIACMDYAFDNGIEWGVWGGVSRDERVTKPCKACGEVKPLEEFRPNQRMRDGRHFACAPCASKAGRIRQADHLPDKDTSVALLNEARDRRTRETADRIRRYARLLAEHGRDRAIEAMGITRRTTYRWDAILRDEQEAAA